MNIPALGFTYAETKEAGRKPYNPDYHSKGKIAEKLLHYKEAVEKYMNLLEQSDCEDTENPPSKYNRKELKEKLEKIYVV